MWRPCRVTGKAALSWERSPCLLTSSRLCPAAVRGRLGAAVHGGPDAGMGPHWPASFHRQDAGPWRLSRPRKLVSAARGHAKSSGCQVPPLQCESRRSVTHTSDGANSFIPETSFSLPVTRGHHDKNTEQLGQSKGTICGKPLARRLCH